MRRQPPRSTLFPYTTSSDLEENRLRPVSADLHRRERHQHFSTEPVQPDSRRESGHLERSEEHTSELQSRQYLVCRLLLEKKNAFAEKLSTKIKCGRARSFAR